MGSPNVEEDTQRLRLQCARAATLARECRRTVASPAGVAKLWQIEGTASLLQHLKRDPLGAHDQLALAAADAEQLVGRLHGAERESITDRDIETAHLLSQRLLLSVGYLALDAGVAAPDESTPGVRDLQLPLSSVAAHYHDDARAYHRWAAALLLIAFAAFAAAVAIALVGAGRASSDTGFRSSEAWSYFAISAMTFAAGVVIVLFARRQRLAGLEATRLERQLEGLDGLLAPMPATLRDVMRGTIIRQLFPRLREDSEPWLEPSWPDPSIILDATDRD